MLRNLMEEDKQLDFNQPLLSVRRFSPTAITSESNDDKKKIDKPIPKLPSLPFYKSELKSGPIRNPGTVPFVWEKTPGNPKDERKSNPKFPQQPHIVPRPPPGQFSSPKRSTPKKGPESKASEPEKTSAATKDKETKTSSSGSEENGEDELFMDALDTLSRSESFSMACSVSGLDRPCEAFSSDPQTRDFMMGRFLPAAKAMASSEKPRFSSRKALNLPREVGRAGNGNRTRPPNQYQLNDLPPYAQELRVVESDGESDINNRSDIMSAKLCGLFPRLCFRSSALLLNPVPGIRVHSQFPTRVHANSSSASSCSETKNEHVEYVVCVQGSGRSDSELKCRSDQIREKRGSLRLNQPSPSRHRQGNTIFSQTKLPELRDYLGLPEKTMNTSRKTGFEVRKSKRRNFQELLASENTKCRVGSRIPVVEKTLYIDSVHTMESPISNSRSLDLKENVAEVTEKEDTLSFDSSSIQDVKSEKSGTLPENLESVDSCSQSISEKKTDTKNVPRGDTDLIQNPLASGDSKLANEESFDSESHFSAKSYDTEKCHDYYDTALTLTRLKISDNQINDDQEKSAEKSVGEIKEGSPYENFLQMNLALPSPKSPSQSWLKRALPVASSRSSRSSLAGRIGISSPITSPLDPKWENIVKSSNLQQGHLRFPEGHLAPIPEA